MPPYEAPEIRFWRMVRKRKYGCWEWTGSKVRGGYGSFGLSRPRSHDRAHRYSWKIHNGPIPDGMWVLHRCDNPPCVRPSHLWLGTRLDNMRDAAAKGRLVVVGGEKHYAAKLTESQAAAILRSREKARILAARYGVSINNIHAIRQRCTWKHLRS